MRYAKDHRRETHEKIVFKAAERFRAEGIGAVGVASLMGSLGLTVGGFYAHFASKDALIAEACSAGFGRTNMAFKQLVESTHPGARLFTLTDAYLSSYHRDAPEEGCFAAAVGAEIRQHPHSTRATFTNLLNAWMSVIDDAMQADGMTGDARGIASTLVGAMTLARSVDDPMQSEAFLEGGRRTIRTSVIANKREHD